MDLRLSHCSRRGFTLGATAVVTGLALLPAEKSLAVPPVEMTPSPVSDPESYDAYVPAACKTGQFESYTCEFDAAWAVLKTFGFDATLEEQIDAIEVDSRIEPYYQESADGVVIYGGDITRAYSGDYTANFLARTTGPVMRPIFKRYGLRVTRVNTRERIEAHLRVGRLIWIKTTVDFLDWVPAMWVTPEGEAIQVVLGNDHAVVVMGYNDRVAVIRDILGPTSSNWSRPYEYEVPWDTFLRCWGAQGSDGLAVGRYEESDDKG